jgi:hypothetical protein
MSLATEKAALEAALAAKSKAITQRFQGIKSDVLPEEEAVNPMVQVAQEVIAKVPPRVWIGAAAGVAIAGLFVLSKRKKTESVEIPLTVKQNAKGESFVVLKSDKASDHTVWLPLQAVGKVAMGHFIEFVSDTALHLLKKDRS